jgi:hypothetical protein
MGPTDVPAVRQLFRDTVALGRPLPFDLRAWGRYEELCLGWYLQRHRLDDHAVLSDEAGRVRGYALVCCDHAGFVRWSRGAGLRWAASTAAALLTRRFGRDEARFHRLRLLDGWRGLRAGVDPAMPAHAHVNLARDARGRMHVGALVEHIDGRCASRRLPGWFGEINAPAGRRRAALEAYGATVVHRMPNRTLSWLRGTPVERLTVVRPLARARPR